MSPPPGEIRICAYPDCGKPAQGRGDYCGGHVLWPQGDAPRQAGPDDPPKRKKK